MFAIHTTMPTMEARAMVRDLFGGQRDNALSVFGDNLSVRLGDPDCFYGWAEPMRYDVDGETDCLRHVLIHAESATTTRVMTRLIVHQGYQCVVTDEDDWSVVHSTFATCYYDAHSH